MDLRPLVAVAFLIAFASVPARAFAKGTGRANSAVPPSGLVPERTRHAPAGPPVTPTPTPTPAPPQPAPARTVGLPPAGVPLRLRDTPRLPAVRVDKAPTLDGRLDDPAWAMTPGTSSFRQLLPYDGLPPTEKTIVRVVYDDEALYVGFDCEQLRTPLVGRLTRRDEDSESDWVWINIDSRRDARTAYMFAVNIKGVLGDGIVHDGNVISYEWDENWEARATPTPRGWSAEMRIPFRVLRFTPGQWPQDWGFWALRFIAVSQEEDIWPYIPRQVAAPIPFFGRLTGLTGLTPGGVAEVRPFALGRLLHRGADTSQVNNGFDGGASAGLDLKLHLTQSMTLDAAVNPDFAQVEADQLILNLNNYEIQYPEKRPLFLEGADLFATPLGLFYSRRIGASPLTPTLRSDFGGTQLRLVEVPTAATIYGAVKLAGRFREAWTVGLLSAVASRSDYDVQAFDAQNNPIGVRVRNTVEPLTIFNVLRLRRDLGDRAQIGVIGTASSRFEDTAGVRDCPNGESAPVGRRCFRDAIVGGIDAVWRSPKAEYVAAAQLVGGVVKDGQAEKQLDGTVIGPGDRGVGGWVRVAREGGRRLLTEAVYTGISKRLTYNDLGYMARQNLHEGKLGVELRSLDPDALTLERHVRLDLTARRNLNDLDLGKTAELAVWFRTKSFWNLRFSTVAAPARFDDREVGDGSALERVGYLAGKADITSDPRARFGVGVKGEWRFLRGGTWVDAQIPLIVRPVPQFSIDLTPQVSFSSGEQRYAWHATENVMASQTSIFGRLEARSASATLRLAYTFSPRLSLQTFGQLFLAAGHYSDFRQVARGTPQIYLNQLTPLTWDLPSDGESSGPQARSGQLTVRRPGPTDADFEQAALNLNVVLRWEYRLGSTLFVVYSRSQVPEVALGATEAALRLSAIGSVPAVDTILVKLSFWWAS